MTKSKSESNPHPTNLISSDSDAAVQASPPKKKAAPKRKLMNVDKDEKKTKKRPARVMLDQDSDDEDSIFDSKKVCLDFVSVVYKHYSQVTV